jgi:hypothetical protein
LGDVVYLALHHRLERATEQLRELWELGHITWTVSIGERMNAGEFSSTDLESFIELGTVTEIDPFQGPDGRRDRRYEVCGINPQGHPAKFTVEVYGGQEGLITEVRWLP